MGFQQIFVNFFPIITYGNINFLCTENVIKLYNKYHSFTNNEEKSRLFSNCILELFNICLKIFYTSY